MRRLFELDSPLMTGLSHMGDWIIFSILSLICSLPVITIGAAQVGIYTAMDRLQQCRVCTVKDYFQIVLENVKQSIVLLGVILLEMLLCGFGVWFYAIKGLRFIAIVFVCLLVFSLMSGVWIFPLQARFSNSIRRTMMNGVSCALLFPVRSILAVVIQSIPLVVFLYSPSLFVYMSIVWIAFWPAVIADVSLRILRKPFNQLS